MLQSPGHSPRHIVPSPSPSSASPAPSSLVGRKESPLLIEGPSRKKKKSEVVLDEDTYVAAIEKIIERDFFPDIPKLHDRLEWLEAVRSGDPMQIRDAQLKIIERRHSRAGYAAGSQTVDHRSASTMADPFSSPWTASVRSMRSPSVAPASVQNQNQESGHQQNQNPGTSSKADLDLPIDTSMPLDEFLRRHTSEDNESFTKIIDKLNAKTREKYSFLLEDAEKKALLDKAPDERERITDGYGTSGQPESTLESWNFQAKNVLMYDSANREEVPLTRAERDERIKTLTKEISSKNTRFHGSVMESRPKEEDNVAILYTPVAGATPTLWPFAERDAERARKKYDLEDLKTSPGDAMKGAWAAKGSAGYSFVRTPSPAPGVDESPFMTWGDIDGTPLRLEDEDTPVGIGGSGDGPHFKIPQPPSRDVKAHDLSRVAARNIREKSRMFQKPPRTPVRSGSASPGFRTLSPAAQKFVRKAMAKSGHSVDATLRASYSASPSPATPKMARGSVNREDSVLSKSSVGEGSVSLRSPTPEA